MKDEQLNNDIQVIENLLTDFKVNTFDRQFTDINKSAKNFVIRNFGINVETTERGYLIATGGYNIEALLEAKEECENFILSSNDEVLNTGYNAIFKNINVLLIKLQPNGNNTEVKVKYKAKEYALAYIFDLYSKGEQIPINRTNDAGFDKKILECIGSEKTNGNFKGNTFYNAVKEIINKYNINSLQDLNLISSDWKNAVLAISENDNEIIKYLKNNSLM